MRISVTRSGGLAGLSRTWMVELDHRDDAHDWIVLIDTLPWGDAPEADAQRDRYLYRIRCETRNEAAAPRPERREAVIPEQKLTGGWRDLVDRVRAADDESPAARAGTD